MHEAVDVHGDPRAARVQAAHEQLLPEGVIERYRGDDHVGVAPMLCDVDEKWGRRRSPRGCFYGFVNHSLVTCGCRQGGLRSAHCRGLREACFSSGALGRVGHLVPHGRVDHLQSLPRDRLERLAVRHPPVPALPVEFAEPVVAPDRGVARGYEQVLQPLVPLAGRRGRRYGGFRPPTAGRQPAALLSASNSMLRTWSTTAVASSGALEKSSSRSRSLFATGALRAIPPSAVTRQAQWDLLPTSIPSTGLVRDGVSMMASS